MSLNRRHYSEPHIRKLSASPPLDGGVLAKQLESELELQKVCQELINSYRETQNWEAVSQVAQTLVHNNFRIGQLKQQIQEAPSSTSGSSSTYLDNILELELRTGSPPAPVPPAPVLPAAVQLQNNRCEESLECRSKDDLDPHLLRQSGDVGEINCGSLEPTEPSPIAVNYPLSPSTHTDSSSPLREVSLQERKESELDTPIVPAEGQHSVEELDDITQLMESLADHFEDLSKEQELSEKTPLHVEENGLADHHTNNNNGAKLEVPVDNKASYASSESSGQFFSPRDSLFGGSDEDDDTQFIDARSEEDRFPAAAWEERQASAQEVFSVTKTSFGSGGVYYVTLEREASMQLVDAVLEPALRTSDEIAQLRDQLGLVAQFPFQLLSDLVGEGEDSDMSQEFENFLNYAASSPSLRRSPLFLNFLREDGNQEETEDIEREASPLMHSGSANIAMQ